MRRLAILLAAVLALAGVAVAVTVIAGDDDSEELVAGAHGMEISKAELDRILLAAEGASESTPKAELEARGEALFRSARDAKPGESCASCHIVGGGTSEGLGFITHPMPNGPRPDFKGLRDAPALWDVGETAPYNWVGGAPTLEAQATDAITTHFSDEDATPERVAAIVAYLRTIKAPQTRHDQGRLTERELAGEEVFVGKGGCIACHGGPQFTDNLIHPTGVPKRDGDTDDGAEGIPGGFNTPQLRDVSNTAPYMHNGIFRTLEEVVDFYNLNELTGGPLRLTPEEKAELVAYLKTL
jgi:cytochrome c peroxidase